MKRREEKQGREGRAQRSQDLNHVADLSGNFSLSDHRAEVWVTNVCVCKSDLDTETQL